MPDREKVIRGLECCHKRGECRNCPYFDCPYWENNDNCMVQLLKDALELLKVQKEERKRLITWLAKFCRHIDNGWMTDQENLEFFKGKMKRQFGWEFSEPPKEENAE